MRKKLFLAAALALAGAALFGNGAYLYAKARAALPRRRHARHRPPRHLGSGIHIRADAHANHLLSVRCGRARRTIALRRCGTPRAVMLGNGPKRTPNPITMLKQDHTKVRRLLREIERDDALH